MVRSALDLARRSGIELAVGDFFVVPLTADNYRTLTFLGDGRPDSERVAFFVKTRLGASADEANQAITRLEQFVRSVPAAGRAEMRAAGALTLSIVAPDQYRGQILDMIAAGRPRHRRAFRPGAAGRGAWARPPGRMAPRRGDRGVPLYPAPARLPPRRCGGSR